MHRGKCAIRIDDEFGERSAASSERLPHGGAENPEKERGRDQGHGGAGRFNLSS